MSCPTCIKKFLGNQKIGPVTEQDSDNAIRSHEEDTKGIGCTSCTELKTFPDCSRHSIAEALNKAEQALASPYQLFVSLNALLANRVEVSELFVRLSCFTEC